MKKITIYVTDQVADATENAITDIINYVWDKNMEVFDYVVEEADEEEIRKMLANADKE